MSSSSLDSILRETKESLAGFIARAREDFANIERRLDALEARGAMARCATASASGVDALLDRLAASPEFQSLQRTGRGRAVVEVAGLLHFERKQVTSSGIIAPYAITDIAAGGRMAYGQVRQLMRSLPVNTGAVSFVRETSFTDAASPAAEASTKPESTFSFTLQTETVRTIAAWTQATKQVLDDLQELGEHIRTSLIYGLERELEEQILLGDGTGQNFNGIVTQAQAFDTSLLPTTPGWNRADVLRAAILQLELDGYGCTAIVVSPEGWFNLEIEKDEQKRYIHSGPRVKLEELLWQRRIVVSPALTGDTFVAGDFDTGAHLRVRQEATVDISDSHSDFFVKNLIAIRAELRAALCVTKPQAFVTGTFTTSPA